MSSGPPSVLFTMDRDEKKLRTVVESIPNGIVMVDEEGQIVLCNSETERMFGYRSGELIGKKVEILVPLRVRDRHPDYRRSFNQKPTKRQMGAGRDLSGRKKDGTEIPVEIGLNHTQSDQGTFIIASIVDITERKKHEEKFRTIVESVPNGIVMVDARGKIVLCNSEIERLFGYEKEELLGNYVEVLVPNRYRGSHPGHREGFIQHPQKRQMGAGRDLTGQKKDGSEIPVEIGLNPIQIDGGTFVLASIADISERKGIEAKLHQVYNEIQQKNLEMEQFVYSVSHDLKSPLVTSMSFIGFLREDIRDKNYDEVMDSLERLEKAHKRMQTLIDDLLQLSRVGRIELHLERLPLGEVIHTISDYTSERLKEKGMLLEVPRPLPEVTADRKRVFQVFENLINNAIKYASKVPHPVIQIIWRDAGPNIEIGVKDNGPGIDRQFHHKIFGLFQRLHADQEGTGVGLTIVSRIMQIHRGRVWVESETGQGAVFWLSFPKERRMENEIEHRVHV